MQPVPSPLEFVLKPLKKDSVDHAPVLPPYFLRDIPLFREDLLEAMRQGGVDNLDAYEAEILDPDSGGRIRDYKAINIIGLLAAADMEKSRATVHPGGPPLLDVDFDGLVVDESKTHGALIFRLAESNNAILVHERLVEHLRRRGFDNLTFLDPAQCAL